MTVPSQRGVVNVWVSLEIVLIGELYQTSLPTSFAQYQSLFHRYVCWQRNQNNNSKRLSMKRLLGFVRRGLF